MSKHFYELAIGDKFYSSGSNWIKSSSRTARLIEFPSRVFYFKQLERVSPQKSD